jgi:hypothetical protein
MTRQRLFLYALLAARTLVSGSIGALLALHLTLAQFAALAAPWAMAGVRGW